MKNNMSLRELTDKMMSLYTDRRYSDALEFVEQNAEHFPQELTRTTFWKMCLLSLCGRVDDVMSIFQQGLDEGLWWAESQFRDTDLDTVRDLPEFKRLMAISQKKYEEARRHIERDQAILLPDAPVSGKYPLFLAVHGRNGNKDSHMEYWDVARRKGWLVLLVQSTQPLSSSAYCWDDPEQGLADILFYAEKISKEYSIDTQRVVTAGFSQGSGMSIYSAMSGKINARGFIGVGTFFAEPNSLIPNAKQANSLRGYFITGEKDYSLERAREIQRILKENNIQFGEEVYSDLGHEFPPDFEKSFDNAIKFIFKEQE